MSKPASFHILQCDPYPFQAVWNGSKRFEYRKADRDYRVGDILVLQEIQKNRTITGREITAPITYILYHGYGLPHGYVVMSLGPVLTRENEP